LPLLIKPISCSQEKDSIIKNEHHQYSKYNTQARQFINDICKEVKIINQGGMKQISKSGKRNLLRVTIVGLFFVGLITSATPVKL
jgi:hypothetical protein